MRRVVPFPTFVSLITDSQWPFSLAHLVSFGSHPGASEALPSSVIPAVGDHRDHDGASSLEDSVVAV